MAAMAAEKPRPGAGVEELPPQAVMAFVAAAMAAVAAAAATARTTSGAAAALPLAGWQA